MTDDILLAAIKRYWTAEQVDSAYQTLLSAYASRLEKVVIITSKGTEGDSASAQIVVNRDDYREWLATLEARLVALEAEESGAGTTFGGTEHVTHSNRFVST